jgi:death-on-curing protein
MNVEILSKSDVIRIHNRLVEDFAQSEDPISPPGVMSMAMLESAIARQYVGARGKLKYPTIHENAATLLYGLCLNHPFHNGNKRTALVAMLAHLDRNKYSLFGTKKRELFRFIIEVADHSFGVRIDPRKKNSSAVKRRRSDEEVAAIANWIYKRIAKVERGERQITYRELRRVLGRFGYSLENPKGNSIDVIKHETRVKGVFRKEKIVVSKRINSISYPGDTRFVTVRDLKHARRICNLREEDGIDSLAFYDEDAVLDTFINEYRTILRRLAHR